MAQSSNKIITRRGHVKILERHSHSAGLVDFYINLTYEYMQSKVIKKSNRLQHYDYDVPKDICTSSVLNSQSSNWRNGYLIMPMGKETLALQQARQNTISRILIFREFFGYLMGILRYMTCIFTHLPVLIVSIYKPFSYSSAFHIFLTYLPVLGICINLQAFQSFFCLSYESIRKKVTRLAGKERWSFAFFCCFQEFYHYRRPRHSVGFFARGGTMSDLKENYIEIIKAGFKVASLSIL